MLEPVICSAFTHNCLNMKFDIPHMPAMCCHLQAAGVTHLWLPPPSQSVSDQGYMPGVHQSAFEPVNPPPQFPCQLGHTFQLALLTLHHMSSPTGQLYNLNSKYGTKVRRSCSHHADGGCTTRPCT